MEPLLSIEHVSKQFPLGGKGKLDAINDVNLQIFQGETLGIVGESGSGKSTIARIVMGIDLPSEGEVRYRGKNIHVGGHRARLAYSKNVQMIFQDNATSLNPRMKIGAIVAESLEIHKHLTAEARRQRVSELLEMVGLPQEAAHRFPHEFSGGQRQRIGIARALCIQPEFLICDEPLSALDMSVQNQIMNILKALKESRKLTYLFIAHDLNMVRYISNRIAVFYKGRVVELADAEVLYSAPAHPYTKMLMEAALTTNPLENKLEQHEMLVWENANINTDGCIFYGRCRYAMECCKAELPLLAEVKSGHYVACYSRTID